MRKLFTFLLCICTLAAVFTTAVFAANISSAQVTVAEPVLGQKPQPPSLKAYVARAYGSLAALC